MNNTQRNNDSSGVFKCQRCGKVCWKVIKKGWKCRNCGWYFFKGTLERWSILKANK